MITGSAARLMRLKNYGIAVGGQADLIALDANDPAEAIAALSQPLWGIKRGHLSFTRARPQLHRNEEKNQPWALADALLS